MGAGLLFFVAAIISLWIVPDQLELAVIIDGYGSSQVVLPVTYWVAIAAFAAWAGREANRHRRSVVMGVAVDGAIVHAGLTLAQLVTVLGDPSGFSSTTHWMYTRAFYGAAVAIGIAWLYRRARHDRRAWRDSELPVALTILVLTTMTLWQDPKAGLAGLAGGALASWCRLSATQRRLLGADWLFLSVVFVLAVALRLLYAYRLLGQPGFLETGADGPVYDLLGWSLASGDGIPSSFTEAYPLLLLGYPRFVAGVYTVAGHAPFAVVAVQAVLGGTACLLVFAIARQLFGSAIARVTAVFAAVSFQLIFAAAAFGHQAIDVVLTTLIVWLLLRCLALPGAGLSRWAGVGTVIGAAIAVRETNAFFAAFVLLWILWGQLPHWRMHRATAVVATALGSAIVLMPLALPSVGTAENRLRLRQHLDRLATGQGDEVQTRTGLAAPFAAPDAALQQIRNEPVFVAATLARAVVHNFAVQFFTQPYGSFDLIFLKKNSRYYFAMWTYAYVLTLGGIWVLARKAARGDPNSTGIVLIAGLLASRTLPHLVLESAYRHRAPIEPFLIMVAAVGLLSILRARRDPARPSF